MSTSTSTFKGTDRWQTEEAAVDTPHARTDTHTNIDHDVFEIRAVEHIPEVTGRPRTCNPNLHEAFLDIGHRRSAVHGRKGQAVNQHDVLEELAKAVGDRNGGVDGPICGTGGTAEVAGGMREHAFGDEHQHFDVDGSLTFGALTSFDNQSRPEGQEEGTCQVHERLPSWL